MALPLDSVNQRVQNYSCPFVIHVVFAFMFVKCESTLTVADPVFPLEGRLYHWRVNETPTPDGPNYSRFHAVLWKFLQNHMVAWPSLRIDVHPPTCPRYLVQPLLKDLFLPKCLKKCINLRKIDDTRVLTPRMRHWLMYRKGTGYHNMLRSIWNFSKNYYLIQKYNIMNKN